MRDVLQNRLHFRERKLSHGESVIFDMVKHTVMYKLKENSPELRKQIRETMYSMKGVVPYIIEIFVGEDVLCSERSYDIILDMKFNSFEDLGLYKKNEYHVNTVQKLMHSVVEKSVSVDCIID